MVQWWKTGPAVQAVWVLAALLPSLAAHAADRELKVVLALEDQANDIWSALPEDPEDSRVTRLGGSSPACAAEALRQARESLARAQGGRLALRTLSLTVTAPRTLLGETGQAGAAYLADLFGTYAQSSDEPDFLARAPRGRGRTPSGPAGDAALRTFYQRLREARSDQAVQPLADPQCGVGAALYDIRALPERPGRLFLHLWVEGGCGCRGLSPGGRRRFRVVGQAELEPGARASSDGALTVRWRIKDARYFLLASCGACEGREQETTIAVSRPALDPCGQLCAPLGGWGEEASRAASQADALASKATALQIDLTVQRKELEDAQAARRKPRSVLERIAALQEKVKTTQAEVTRVTHAVDEAREHLTHLRKAVDEGRAAGERCQAECKARPAKAAPDAGKAAQAGGAGGGGLGTGTLVIGGVGVAGAAAAVALASGGGSNDAPPTFEGTWTGPRIISAIGVGGIFDGPPCVRTFNEVWTIRRTGDTLDAYIQSVPGACDPGPCLFCNTLPFDGTMSATVEGSTARFVVYPGFPCILTLNLQRDVLAGTMPRCGSPASSAMDVMLRRTGN